MAIAERLQANRTEREAAEKKTRIAREEMRKIESELQAKEAELAALKDLTDKSVAERDQTERDLQVTQDKIQKTQVHIAQEKKRMKDAQAAARQSQERLQQAQDKLKNLEERGPSNASALAASGSAGSTPVAGGRVARTEGWVVVKRDCGLKAQAETSAADTSPVKSGAKLYGKKIGPDWLEVRSPEHGSGFLPIGCVR